jgi:predicted kinase
MMGRDGCVPGQRPRVHLVCGLLAAGKTTYARQLAAQLTAARFTLDEWMIRLYGLRYDDPTYVARLEGCQDLIWDVALQVLGLGHDVVLDWNMWSRKRRAFWQARAKDRGYEVLLHHLDVPLETAIAQALQRASDPGAGISHVIDEAGARHFASIFEPPTADEGVPIRVVRPPGTWAGDP